MIRFDHVRVAFGDAVVLEDLELDVAEGEFFTLLGPSGCGKTTALRTLAGFIRPNAGDVFIAGQRATHLPSEKRQVGMVFQNYALFPSMSVRENIGFGLKVQRLPKSEIAERVGIAAEQVQLATDQLDKSVAELSGGQQQRVAIARALVLRPRILLLDEPLSNLDAKLRVQLREQLKALQTEVGITTVYVTHDQEEALTMSDRVAVFNAGRVEQVGTPSEVYAHSATPFVATFLGAINTIAPALVGRIAAQAAGTIDPTRKGFVRPEKLWLTPPQGATEVARLDATVVSRSYHGAYNVYTVESAGESLRVMANDAGGPVPEPGESVAVYVDPVWVMQFPES